MVDEIWQDGPAGRSNIGHAGGDQSDFACSKA
jgi:hypothetical protein